MASSSSVDASRISENYTLGDYFRDHNVSKKSQKKIIHRINLASSALSSGSEIENSCTEESKSKNLGYFRKFHLKKLPMGSASDSKYPIVLLGDRRFVVLKEGKFSRFQGFKFSRKSVLKCSRKKGYENARKGGYKMVFPAVEITAASNRLDMNIFAWAKITDNTTKVVPKSPRDENIHAYKKISKIETAFDREVGLLTEFRSPHTVEFLESVKFSGKKGQLRFGMMMEWCPETLSKRMTREPSLSIEKKLEYAKALIQMLLKLKEKEIYFRDLKGDNLLIDAGGNLKLSDFGLAVPAKDAYKSFSGTFNYYAPEYKLGEILIDDLQKKYDRATTEKDKETIRGQVQEIIRKHATLKGDVWTAGIIIYKLFYGKHPIVEMIPKHSAVPGDVTPEALYETWLSNSPEFIQKLIGKLFIDNPKSNTLRGVLKGMLVLDPKLRFSCELVNELINREDFTID